MQRSVLIGSDVEMAKMLLDRLDLQDYTGLDPSIIKQHLSISSLRGNSLPLTRSLSAITRHCVELLGHRVLRFIEPTPAKLPKCMALAAMANISVYRQSSDHRYLSKANMLVSSLMAMKRKCNVWSHGVPYNMNGQAVLADTPNLVTTFFVSQAVHMLALALDEEKINAQFRTIVEAACEIFPQRVSEVGACYMYTPRTNYHVHNANLMMVQMIGQYFDLKGSDLHFDEACRALAYSLHDFTRKKGLPYAGVPTPCEKEDNYHTGYVLRSLKAIRDCQAFPEYTDRIDDILSWGVPRYWKTYLQNGYIVRDHRRINSHSLAEAILVRKLLGTTGHDAEAVDNAIEKTIKLLWNQKEHRFDNQTIAVGPFEFRDKTDLPRWSQAWLAYALAFQD